MKKFNFLSNLKSKFIELKNKNKKLFFVTICLIFVVLILAFSCLLSIFSGEKSSTNSSSSSDTFSSSVSYADYLSCKLENMIGLLNEVNEVSVLVTVSSSETYEYLMEKSSETETAEDGSSSEKVTESIVLEKDGSSQSPVLVRTILPDVIGVMIVVNKISSSTKFSIISSVSTVLNIDSECISILQES